MAAGALAMMDVPRSAIRDELTAIELCLVALLACGALAALWNADEF